MRRATNAIKICVLFILFTIFSASFVYAGTTINVTTTMELIDAINDANSEAGDFVGADTIILDDDITLTSEYAPNTALYGSKAGLPNINSEITIQAGDAAIIQRSVSTCAGDEANPFRIFSLTGNSTLTLDGVTVQNGCVLGADSNPLTEVAFGGGIAVSDSANLVLNNATVTNNTARGGDGQKTLGFSGAAIGGGVYIQGDATISGSVISNNTSQGGNNSQTDFAYGGGIFISGTSAGIDEIENSIILGNVAQAGTNPTFANPNPTTGGGIFVFDGDINLITNTRISGNSVFGGSNSGAQGGGIYADGNATVTLIENSEISGNSVTSGTGDSTANAGGLGGADYVTIRNTTISGNTVTSLSTSGMGFALGGGVNIDGAPNNGMRFEGVTIAANQTSVTNGAGGSFSRGGGYYQFSAIDVVFFNSVIADNTAEFQNSCNIANIDSHSWIESVCSGTAGGSNIFLGSDPGLGSLTDASCTTLLPDGSCVRVHPTTELSGLVDVGSCGATLTTDQIDTARPQGSDCDIGAYELTSDAPDGTDATITLLPDDPVPGDTLTITVTDADRNLFSDSAETVEVTLQNTDRNGTTEVLTLTETGDDTGEFTGTLATVNALGDDGQVNGSINVVDGQTVVAAYTDEFNTGGSSTDRTASQTFVGGIPLVDGTIAITPEEPTIGETLTITVTDDDRDTSGSADTVAVTVQNTTQGGPTETVTLTETGPETGIFTGMVDTMGMPESAALFAMAEVSLSVVIDDVVEATYVDEFNQSGTSVDRTDSVTFSEAILGTDATIDITPDDPVVGDTLTITVTDDDRDTSGSADTVAVTVQNTTQGGPVLDVTLTETGAATGVFTGTVESDGMTDSVSVVAGDTVEATYNDAFNQGGSATDRTDSVTFAAADTPPQVTTTTPTADATGVSVTENITVNFSEAVDVTSPGPVISVSCPSYGGSPSNYSTTQSDVTSLTFNPADFALDETCEVTVVAAQITDRDGTSALNLDGNQDGTGGDDFTFSFTTPPTDAQVQMEPATVSAGAPLTITVIDRDRNLDGAALDTVTATVQNTTHPGTVENLTLTETGNDTGIFGVSVNTVDADGPDGNGSNGSINVQDGDTVTATYSDEFNTSGASPVDRTDTSTVSAASSGDDTVGAFYPSTGSWNLRDENSAGQPTVPTFTYGRGGVPVVGDWNNDGTETVGAFYPSTGSWNLRDENSAGQPTVPTFTYGRGGVPVVGDWNNDGTDTVGVFYPSTGTWYLRDENSAGQPTVPAFTYGRGGVPVVGDWNNDGTDTVGVFYPSTGTWYLRDVNNAGQPTVPAFTYGRGGVPVVGDWNGAGQSVVALAPQIFGLSVVDVSSNELVTYIEEGAVLAHLPENVQIVANAYGGAGVMFDYQGVEVFAVDREAPYTLTGDVPTALAAGDHTLTATLLDEDDNILDAITVSFTVK